jgi:MHS family proline/betaine transporter-like MFS transporter
MSETRLQNLPHKKTIFASTLAIILEWFDFAIFGYYAVLLSQLFFPFTDDKKAILSTFLVFALSFLFRPLGSVIIGSIGDRFGRKNAFILTVVFMTFPTVMIGLLPTYESIGITATVLLIVLRITQALSVGGERSATLSLFTELAPPHFKGVYGSMSLFGTTCGILLASAVTGLVSNSMSESDLMSWGWRIPFLLGALSGITAIFLRKIVNESEIFQESVKSGNVSKSPIRESLKEHWRTVLVVLSATLMFAVSFYLIFVYIITFSVRHGNMSLAEILTLNTVILGLITILFPFSAYLSDRVGRKPSLIVGCAGMIIVGLLLFKAFSGTDLTYKILVQSFGGLVMVIFAGAFAPFMVESFPTKVRMSGISLGNVIGFSVFGGSAPLVASYLISSTGSVNAPGIYLSICSIISLIAVLTIRETYKNKLD